MPDQGHRRALPRGVDDLCAFLENDVRIAGPQTHQLLAIALLHRRARERSLADEVAPEHAGEEHANGEDEEQVDYGRAKGTAESTAKL